MCARHSTADAETLAAEQQTLRQERLRESIAAGWSDTEHMQQDPDLAILRDNPEFAELLSEVPNPQIQE